MPKTAGEFIDYIKNAEGFSPTVYNDVGSPAIGWGYRTRPGEDFSGGIDEEKGTTLLHKSITEATAAARRAVPNIREGADFDSLPRDSQYKLIEYSMNLGPDFYKPKTRDGREGFPLWARSVVDGDADTERQEHKRFSGGLEMKRRNQGYEDFYFGAGGEAASPENEEPGSSGSAERLTPAGESEGEGAGDSPLSPIEQLLSSDQFRALSPEQRLEALADESPKFRQLYDADPAAAEDLIGQLTDASTMDDPSFWSSLQGGFRVGAGSAAWTMANAAMLAEKLGFENDYDESWRKFADIQFLDGGAMIGSDWYDIVGSVMAGLPGGIAVPGIATALAAVGLPLIGASAGTSAALAPVLGFGLSGALSASDEGGEAALKRGLVDAALGAIYPATAHLSRMQRLAIEGGAAFAVSEQDNTVRRGQESMAIALLAAMPGRRAPFEVMQRLGVQDRGARLRQASRDAKLAQEANVQTQAALEVPTTDAYGNQITSLVDAMRTYGEAVRNEHPMTSRPMDRSPHELAAIASRVQDSAGDTRAINRDVVPDRQSAEFKPGHEWVEQRAFTVEEGNAARLVRDYKKAGEVVAPLAEAFQIPSHPGLGAHKKAGVSGWYAHLMRNQEGKLVNPRRLQVRDRTNVQTFAHEWGHDASFLDPGLRRMHDYRQKEVRVDFERIDEIATAAGVGPEQSAQGGTQFSGVVDANGKATVSGIFKLHREGKIPEDLRYIPELLSVSYDRDNLTEGMAETFRLWMTNNSKYGGAVNLEQKFPHVMEAIETWRKALPRKKQKAIERFQKDANEHLSANGRSAIAGVMGSDMNAAEVLSTRAVRMRQAMFDDTAGIMNMVQVTYGRQVPGSVLETFRNLRGATDAADRMIKFGAPTWNRDKFGGRMIEYQGDGIEEILLPVAYNGGSLDRFFRYAVARGGMELKLQYRDPKTGRVKNLMEADAKTVKEITEGNLSRERLMTNEMIQDSMRLAKDHPEYLQVYQKLMDFAEKMADFGEGAGLWSKGQRANWKRAQYIFSFFREMESRAAGGDAKSRSLVTSEPTHTLTGSTRQLRDPFQNLLESHSRTMRMALENVAKQELARFVKNVEGGGRFGEILKPLAKMKDFRIDELRDAARTELRRAYPHLAEADKAGGTNFIEQLLEKNLPTTGDLEKLTMFLGNQQPRGESVMTYFVGGEAQHMAIQDPMLLASIKAMRRPAIVGLEKYWNNLRKFKQHFITIGPGFIAGNFGRDTLMASVMSKTGNFHLAKSLEGLWGAIRKDKDFQDYHANGGGSAGLRETPAQTRRKLIAHAQRKGFNPRRLILDAGNVVGFLDYIGRTMEIASRLGEYKAARKQGARASHAAYLGREVSTDFAVRGDSRVMNFFGNTVPFFNAMVAGGDRTYRSVRYDPSHKLATAAKMGTVGMMSMALYGINRTIGEYMDLPDWDKWGYWHFFVPKYAENGDREKNGDGQFEGQLAYDHFKIPKIWEVGSIGTIGERVSQFLLDGDDEDGTSFAADVMQIVGQNFGLNFADRGFPLPIPVGLDTVIEQFSNRLLYTGNPIESAAMANQEAWSRSRPSQARVYGEYGRLMEQVPGVPDGVKSPARAEAFLRGMFGEFASIGAFLADSAFFPGGPAGSIDRAPVVSRFYEGTGKYSRQAGEFYERLESFKQAQNTMRQMATNPRDAQTVERWSHDPQKMREIALADQFEKAKGEISAITEYQNQLQGGAMPVSPAEAAKQIRDIEQQKRMIMQILNDLDREMKRGQ